MAAVGQHNFPKGRVMVPRCLVTAVCILVIWSFSAVAASPPSHLDRKNLPNGCSSCHVGFDFSNGGGAARCLGCHGSTNPRFAGWASKIKTSNVAADFAKTYRHPSLDLRSNHNSREILPEREQNKPRHADCVDCHNPHNLSHDNPYAGLKGKRTGNFNATITKEYELCYLCHAESANLPLKSTNKRTDFSLNNMSFHPVEGEGRNTAVVSLLRPYRERKLTAGDINIISCSDCHASDDPKSPRGPHGSRYQSILVENYNTGDNIPESSFTYAICYRCHKRTSILGNESFPFHSRHITGERNFKRGGTSCHTCHSSHGSVENRYLLRFNREFVSESSSGKLKFVEKGVNNFHGECWLTCHGVDHNPKTY